MLPWNWRQRIELVHYPSIEGEPPTEFKLQFVHGKTPKGYQNNIGILTIDHEDGFVCSAEIYDSRLHNRGLGLLLYKYALNVNGILSTTYHDASSSAQRVWNSLVRRYLHSTDFFRPRLYVYNKRIPEDRY